MGTERVQPVNRWRYFARLWVATDPLKLKVLFNKRAILSNGQIYHENSPCTTVNKEVIAKRRQSGWNEEISLMWTINQKINRKTEKDMSGKLTKLPDR